ncbi:sensor histidine kinase [Modestobacter altitudinis]|uniref:sensor histidine kinase n=1 Tax=Modestobacter altitudinis TaxID=2213158 RepID=UPI0014869DFD|nr:histidine kinase [Modestobacter altitudinis]
MPSVAGWWAGRSDPQRIALYTRSSYYAALAVTPLVALLVVVSSASHPPFAAALFLLGSVAVTVTALLLARAGLTAPGPDKRLPTRLLVGAAAAALATVGTGVAAVPDGGDAGSLLPWVLGLAPTMVLIACSTVWPTRTLTVGGVGIGVLEGVGLLSAGRTAAEALVLGVLFGLTSTATALSFRFSVWVLDVVTQLERARDVQARLAVAEERLRFARDLHDVMGRNLSTIAVKGQLAAELVRRGRAEAADEVTDISRIADESLREMRGVVGGYRSASLPGELAGARSVLRAAGVSCTVSGDEEAALLPAAVQAALGWAVREAVTNVLRHSQAITCTIGLTSTDGETELRVVNDGATEPADRRWGNGLTGVAERLDAAGGRLMVARVDGRFELTATLPVVVPA